MSSTAREVVSRLLDRESSATSDSSSSAIAATVLQRICADLRVFIGSDGCQALLTRALSQAKATHPALKDISIIGQPDLSLQGVAESVQAHGPAPTAAGLESTTVALIELLGRLIGDELAMKIVEQNSSGGGLPNTPRRRDDE